MGNREPKFDFGEPPKGKPEQPTYDQPDPRPYKPIELDQGWCGECDMPAGDGNCIKCDRIKKQRGDKNRFVPHAGPGSPEWQRMKDDLAKRVRLHKEQEEKKKNKKPSR